MKIICIGRNYVDHAKELGNQVPDEPVIFLKPETAIIPKKMPFFLPDFSQDVHYELELVVRINRVGKNIEERFAFKYYNEIALGIDFTARDLQSKLKAKGLPWEKAKGFDGSAFVSPFIPFEKQGITPQNCQIRLDKNGEVVQDGTTQDMLFSIDQIIAHISQFYTLKIGDLIFTGTPAGVGKVSAGDKLSGFLNSTQVFDLQVK